jgi:hypothetical protein
MRTTFYNVRSLPYAPLISDIPHFGSSDVSCLLLILSTQQVLIVGAGRIMDASILTGLYLVPFAVRFSSSSRTCASLSKAECSHNGGRKQVYGQNIFSGLLFACNDSAVLTKAECAGEYMVETVDGWGYLAPRVWQNPQVWSFDSFKSALLILFEIISLEGWIDVMESVMTIRGKDLNKETNASQWNALFFVGFNAVGAVFMYALFPSLPHLGITDLPLPTASPSSFRSSFKTSPSGRMTPSSRPSNGSGSTFAATSPVNVPPNVRLVVRRMVSLPSPPFRANELTLLPFLLLSFLPPSWCSHARLVLRPSHLQARLVVSGLYLALLHQHRSSSLPLSPQPLCDHAVLTIFTSLPLQVVLMTQSETTSVADDARSASPSSPTPSRS